jgi:CBS domain-containing protein
MDTEVRRLSPDVAPIDAADAIRSAPDGELPVTDAAGHPLGVLTSRAVAEQLSGENGEAEGLTGLVEARPVISPDATVADALDLLDHHDARGLAVVEHGRMVGWFCARAVLARIRSDSRGRRGASVPAEG